MVFRVSQPVSVSTATILFSFRDFFPSFGYINLFGTLGVFEERAGAD